MCYFHIFASKEGTQRMLILTKHCSAAGGVRLVFPENCGSLQERLTLQVTQWDTCLSAYGDFV